MRHLNSKNEQPAKNKRDKNNNGTTGIPKATKDTLDLPDKTFMT